jgi:hypothetical protein
VYSVAYKFTVVNDLKVIFMFVDGLGLGPDDPAVNPLRGGRCPKFRKLLESAIPLDACMSVDGLPQSATGQAALLTGVNAPKEMGRHIEGFPPPSLKKLVEHENIFTKLGKRGARCTFANSYVNNDPHKIPMRKRSVTTVMTLHALGGVRGRKELEEGRAVTHDITRWTMHTRGYDCPRIAPEEAAQHLLNTAEEADFTLFEYFLTDRAGHSGKPELVQDCLDTLERFVPLVAAFAEQPDHLFLLSSDHGNIEDTSTRQHTTNPVPLVAIGAAAGRFSRCSSLTDVTPAILDLYSH